MLTSIISVNRCYCWQYENEMDSKAIRSVSTVYEE